MTCLLTAPAFSATTPTNPTGTSSTSQVMMGLGLSLTPLVSGVVIASLVGSLVIGSTNQPSSGTVQWYYGTGSAPTNGASVTGTAIGSQVLGKLVSDSGDLPFTVLGSFVGTVGITYWLDVAVSNGGGSPNVTSLSALSAVLQEIFA